MNLVAERPATTAMFFANNLGIDFGAVEVSQVKQALSFTNRSPGCFICFCVGSDRRDDELGQDTGFRRDLARASLRFERIRIMRRKGGCSESVWNCRTCRREGDGITRVVAVMRRCLMQINHVNREGHFYEKA